MKRSYASFIWYLSAIGLTSLWDYASFDKSSSFKYNNGFNFRKLVYKLLSPSVILNAL